MKETRLYITCIHETLIEDKWMESMCTKVLVKYKTVVKKAPKDTHLGWIISMIYDEVTAK